MHAMWPRVQARPSAAPVQEPKAGTGIVEAPEGTGHPPLARKHTA